MGTEGTTVLEPLWQGLPPLDPGALSSSASSALPPRFEAVQSARDFTRSTLGGWGLSEHCDGVTLVVSELVTNALRHGLPGCAPAFQEAPVRLHLMRWASRLVCAVRDPSRTPPISALDDADPFAALADFADVTAESGRGLFLVESFSDSWGWQPLPEPQPGKVVWALFRLGPVPS
ncbi:ATP-binding protein [Streptomyces sp. 549]|uniref:ATP-binding protein n=1 Tax=Streptomyces sp. 549 TaxID=3049076 RepID=UPI0024C3F29A|nr:ATP-binding protein [Streptomyces sp. 549]MDK1472290.1 ATP-binding protein [Streptomyces sp. 549]